jgi:hypothetical protein
MKKYLKYIYYAFFVLALLFIIEAIRNFNIDPDTAYMQLGFAGILIIYGLFRLRYMKKFQEYHKKREEEQNK